jgi:hypothetical protein
LIVGKWHGGISRSRWSKIEYMPPKIPPIYVGCTRKTLEKAGMKNPKVLMRRPFRGFHRNLSEGFLVPGTGLEPASC